jgi:hypothetical protein
MPQFVCVCVCVCVCGVCVCLWLLYVYRIVQQIIFCISWTIRLGIRIFQDRMRIKQRGYIDRTMFGKKIRVNLSWLQINKSQIRNLSKQN